MSDNSPLPARDALRKTPSQERSRELVDRILVAAARLFEEQGRAKTTTNHIASQAGVSVGSLYQYFGNKEGILVALGHRHLDVVEPALEELSARLRSSEPCPGALCDCYVDEVTKLNDSTRLHTILWHATGTADFNDRLARLKARVSEDLAWHLRRFGHDETTAKASAELLIVMVDAAVHAPQTGSERSLILAGLKRACRAVAWPPTPSPGEVGESERR